MTLNDGHPFSSCSVMSNSLRPHGLLPTTLLYPWDSPGKNTGMGSHSLLQGIFPTQGLNLGVLHCGQILYHLRHQGSRHFIWNVNLMGFCFLSVSMTHTVELRPHTISHVLWLHLAFPGSLFTRAPCCSHSNCAKPVAEPHMCAFMALYLCTCCSPLGVPSLPVSPDCLPSEVFSCHPSASSSER